MMTMHIRFVSMLNRYSAPYTLVRTPVINPDDAYDAAGKFKPLIPEPKSLSGSIQPISAKWLQLDGGKYTEDDRVLYTSSIHQNGDVIQYRGQQYTIDDGDERPDYCDTNKYMLKRVTTHDPV
jgi:hypothetical protein